MINLLGCGSPRTVLGAFKRRCVIEENTLKEVVRDPFINGSAQPTMDQLMRDESLIVQRMSAAAYAQYLDLVSPEPRDALGRGESAAIAHANDIGGVVVLDDLKARRIARARFGACEQWTSVTMFRGAAESLGLTKEQTSALICTAREKARMHVLAEDLSWVESLPAVLAVGPARVL